MAKKKQIEERIRERKAAEAHDMSGAEQKFAGFLTGQIFPNLKNLLLGLCILLLIGALLHTWQKAQKEDLAVAFTRLNEAQSVDELQEIAEKYKGKKPGELAAFKRAQKLFEEEKFGEARDAFAAFLEAYPASEQRLDAQLGRAYSLEAEGEYEQAAETFVSVAEEAGTAFLEAEAWVGAGRCARTLDDPDNARTYYENAVSTASGGLFVDRASEALQQVAAAATETPDTPSPEQQ